MLTLRHTTIEVKNMRTINPDVLISGSHWDSKLRNGDITIVLDSYHLTDFGYGLVPKSYFPYSLHYLNTKSLFAVALTVDSPALPDAFLSLFTIPGPLSTVLISFRDPGIQLQPHTKSHLQTGPVPCVAALISSSEARPSFSNPSQSSLIVIVFRSQASQVAPGGKEPVCQWRRHA